MTIRKVDLNMTEEEKYLAIKKLVDLNQVSGNNSLKTLIVIEDRLEPNAANNETKVLTAISNVLPMTKLEQLANVSASLN